VLSGTTNCNAATPQQQHGVSHDCSLPYWMEVLNALAVPAIRLLAAVIGYFQWKTAQQKVVLDLFDRRMTTYTALREVVAMVRGHQVRPLRRTVLNFLGR
jgi:hypothetical protein